MAKLTSKLSAVCIALGLAFGSSASNATEGGGLGPYPDGLENFMSGALPPPGVHTLVYAGGAKYDTLRGANGNRIGPPDFKVNFGVVAPRVVWVTSTTVLGGNLAFEALVPLLNVKVTAGGRTWRSSGIGDVVLGAAIGWHHSPALHSVAALDVFLPTGEYSATDPSSLGKNAVTVQPIYAVSLVNPSGLNADAKLMLDLNRRNRDTQTRSGHAFHADYAVGWGFGNGWVAGLGGHVFRQLGDDSGPNAGPGKARAIGIGPSLRYFDGKGLLITAKFQKEFNVRSRPEGTQFFVKATLPF